MWLRIGRRWLPTGLPKHSLAVLNVRMAAYRISCPGASGFYRDTGPSEPTLCR